MLTADKLRENRRTVEKVLPQPDNSYKIQTLEKIRRILIDGEFVNYLEKVSKRGYDKVLFSDNYVTLTDSKTGKTSNDYGGGYYFFFVPNQNTEEGGVFYEVMTSAGFNIEFVEKECPNFQYVVTADGYDIEDCAGTHIDYSVLVSW